MKTLRHSAPTNILFLVYKALCQSLIIYCIRVWGGAAKTILIDLERAQRAVLKVMLHKPFRFNTDELYRDCRVLRVRQLFILRATMNMHRATLKSNNYEQLANQRVFKVPTPAIRTTFAGRQPHYLLPYVYNVVCRKLELRYLTTHQLKQHV
ncbi:hypothetical protein ABMA28_013740 [Loxostege sticticalis]|uniref:RNA-directed DNA polymerase from mobile element jockey n=1 Tax=Loxostege sticticalis TaxID=481309 RepID=A0ABD0TJN4_LOXSC